MAQGGFGNQLFCYAYAHWLRNQTSKKIVISQNHRTNSSHSDIQKILINCDHNIEEVYETQIQNILKIRDKVHKTIPCKLIDRFLRLENFNEVSDYLVNKGRANIYRGFYQNYELVDSVFEVIKKEITTKTNMCYANFQLNYNFVPKDFFAIHVRRGDYLNSKNSYGVLTLEYYKQQIRNNLPLIIAADDPNYINQLKEQFPNAFILDPIKFSTWETFSVLCNARILITANSTFSWWAGKIVTSNEGKVIAPKPWFKNNSNRKTELESPEFDYQLSLFE